MSITTVPDWYSDHLEIARLLRWRAERGELTIPEAIYLVEKPAKHTQDYRAMLIADLLGDDVALEFGRRLDEMVATS